MADPLKALAAVNFLSAQYSGDELRELANEQEDKVKQMKDVREVQDYYDTIVADGEITEGEHDQLMAMMQGIGIDINDITDKTIYFEANAGGTESEAVAEENEARYEGYASQIDNVLESLEDDQGLLEFKIQMATNEYTSSTNQASTLEKRVNDLQNQLIGRLEG